MTYATLQHLEDSFGAVEIRQLADRDRSGTPDAAFVDGALARADALIESYLAGRYALPLVAPFPPVIIATACDLARYWLYDDAVPDQVRKRYEDALAWLKDIASGKVFLALPAVTAATSPIGSPAVSAPDRLFTAETLARF